MQCSSAQRTPTSYIRALYAYVMRVDNGSAGVVRHKPDGAAHLGAAAVEEAIIF
jgi:hypothetical protein